MRTEAFPLLSDHDWSPRVQLIPCPNEHNYKALRGAYIVATSIGDPHGIPWAPGSNERFRGVSLLVRPEVQLLNMVRPCCWEVHLDHEPCCRESLGSANPHGSWGSFSTVVAKWCEALEPDPLKVLVYMPALDEYLKSITDNYFEH